MNMSKAAAGIMDDTFRTHIENVIHADSDVLLDNLPKKVLHEITRLWVTIRGFSFARSTE